jgi:RNA polymerase sigma-70 factor (ECF subfamily)
MGIVCAPASLRLPRRRVTGTFVSTGSRTPSGSTVRTPQDEDAELVRRVAAGDRKALSALYDRYASPLLGLGLRVLGVRSEAEDLLHDVFLEVWKRAGDYDPARGTVRAWLCLRMRSRALDRQKSPRVSRAVAWDDARQNETEAPHQDPGLRMERERVRAALASLSTDQREVVELCYFAGLSTQEAAEKLSCPVGTVKSRLSAARERLRSALADGMPGGAT